MHHDVNEYRHEIEVEYVDHLKKLAQREHADDRSGLPPSWRKATSLVRATTFEDAQAHAAFATALDDVVKKLDKLNHDKDRMRRRVDEDLRRTRDAHNDYAQVVERLRKTYERKVEEVQAHERDESERDQHERELPIDHWTGSEAGSAKAEGNRERKGSVGQNRAPTPGTATPKVDNDSLASSAAAYGSPPTSGFTPPVFVSGAGTTGTSISSPYREPPSGKPNVFEAIAKRDWNGDKSRINSIARAVGNLAKGGDMGPGGQGMGHHKSNSVKGSRSRVTSSKLKREAEQADRDYRDGVWRCETLRLQRNRVQGSARTFLIDFAGELSWMLKDVMRIQSIGLHNVGGVMHHIGDALKQGAEEMQPQADAEDFSYNLRSAPPESPVYYRNYFVGECRDLIFGVSLVDYHSTHPDRMVPQIVEQCIAFVDSHGLRSEGIYRISGKQTTVQQLVHTIESNERDFRFDDREDPATVAGLLKLYLRQLPTALFPFQTADRLAFSTEIMKDYESAMTSLSRRLRRLPAVNQATLKALVEHLARVAQNEQSNKMPASNLGLIFSAIAFSVDDEAITLEFARNSTKDLVMEVLISQHSALFEELPLDTTKARSRGASPIGRIRSRGASGSSLNAPDHHQTQHHRSLLAPTPDPVPVPPQISNVPLVPIESPIPRHGSPADVRDPRLQHIASTSRSASTDHSPDSVYRDYRDASSQLLPTQQMQALHLQRVQQLHHDQPHPSYPSQSQSDTPEVFPTQRGPNDPNQEAMLPPIPGQSRSRTTSDHDMLPPAPQFIRSRTGSDHNLSTPSPPLSAAGGRRVPEGSSSTI